MQKILGLFRKRPFYFFKLISRNRKSLPLFSDMHNIILWNNKGTQFKTEILTYRSFMFDAYEIADEFEKEISNSTRSFNFYSEPYFKLNKIFSNLVPQMTSYFFWFDADFDFYDSFVEIFELNYKFFKRLEKFKYRYRKKQKELTEEGVRFSLAELKNSFKPVFAKFANHTKSGFFHSQFNIGAVYNLATITSVMVLLQNPVALKFLT